MEASLASVKSNLFKSWSLGAEWGHNGESNSYIRVKEKKILKNFLAKTLAWKAVTCGDVMIYGITHKQVSWHMLKLNGGPWTMLGSHKGFSVWPRFIYIYMSS